MAETINHFHHSSGEAIWSRLQAVGDAVLAVLQPDERELDLAGILRPEHVGDKSGVLVASTTIAHNRLSLCWYVPKRPQHRTSVRSRHEGYRAGEKWRGGNGRTYPGFSEDIVRATTRSTSPRCRKMTFKRPCHLQTGARKVEPSPNSVG